MIYIENNQSILEDENIIVSSETGNYDDNELLECFSQENPGFVVGAFQAQFIKYGGLVYKFSDPLELGSVILEIDPESTHTAASYVRMNNELLRQMNEGSLESNSLNQVISDEKTSIEEKVSEDVTTKEDIPNIEPKSEPAPIDVLVEEEVPIVENTENPPEELPSLVLPSIEESPTVTEEIISYAKRKIINKLKA